jgi:hypothetical protein
MYCLVNRLELSLHWLTTKCILKHSKMPKRKVLHPNMQCLPMEFFNGRWRTTISTCGLNSKSFGFYLNFTWGGKCGTLKYYVVYFGIFYHFVGKP